MQDQLISASCGAGAVLVCEAEYLCWKLFKRKNLFFFTCQLAILSSAISTAINGVIHLAPNVPQFPMFITILILAFVMGVSYPIMLLLRLRILYRFNLIFIFIPIFQGILWTGLKYFWLSWVLTGNDYKIYIIIQTITIVACFGVQDIAINVFFMVLAKKKFDNIHNIRNVFIINTIAIGINILIIMCELFLVSTWVLVPVFIQIQVRLELTVLVYIVETHHPMYS
jgi:hypothetical protein